MRFHDLRDIFDLYVRIENIFWFNNNDWPLLAHAVASGEFNLNIRTLQFSNKSLLDFR